MRYSCTIGLLAVAASFASGGCASKTEISNKWAERAPLKKQTLLLQMATLEARAGRREQAVRIADEANGLSWEVGYYTRRRFRYDVPYSWCYIHDGNPVCTMASYGRARKEAADLAAAAMGLLVAFGRTGEFDFARELSESIDPLTVQKVAQEQASRGEAEEAAAWAERLIDDRLREHARLENYDFRHP